MTDSETKLTRAPRLSPDFAARVMREADRRRHRRVLLTLAGTGLAASLAAAAIVWVLNAPTRAPGAMIPATEIEPARQAAARAAEVPAAMTETEAAWNAGLRPRESSDALSYFFPDATPLANFVDNYSIAAYGVSRNAGVITVSDGRERSGAE